MQWLLGGFTLSLGGFIFRRGGFKFTQGGSPKIARGVQIYPGGFTENSRGVHIFRFVSINTTLAKPASFRNENWRV